MQYRLSLSTLKRVLSVKTALLILLVIIVFTLIVVIQRARRKETQPPGVNPTFGDIPAPKPSYVSQMKPPQSTELTPDEQINLSETATVFRRASTTLTDKQARDIARSFGISGEPLTSKTSVTFRENNRVLIVSFKKGSLSYFEPLQEYLKDFRQKALEDYALILLKQLYPGDPLWANPKVKTGFFTIIEMQDFKPTAPNKADLAIVDLYPTIEGLSIVGPFDPFGHTGMVSIQFNKRDGSLVLNGLPTGLNTAQVGTYPLKSLDAVQEEIKLGQVTLTATIPEGQTPKSVDWGQNLDPTKASFTSIELVYYYDPDPNAFLQPIYLFSGKTTLTDGRPANIFAILPAIDPQYLKP